MRGNNPASILIVVNNGDCKIILMSYHHFVKETQKTPLREIEKARKRMKDFLEEANENEK